MRHSAVYPGILVSAVLALSSLFLIGPRLGTHAQTTTNCCGLNPPTAPRELVFPYYSLADGFNSTLMLVSSSPTPLSFIIVVHSLNGQTELSPSMGIQPGEKLAVDMRRLLTSLGADVTGTFSQGNASVYLEGTIMPLAGQMTIENPQRHWVQQAEMVENDPGRTDIPAVLSGQWWGLAGGRDATIMVTNASGNLVTADLLLAVQGEVHTLQPLVFNPNETKLLSVAGLLATLGLSVAQAPEGRITIIQRGATPALAAQGSVTDPATGFSTTLEFPDPARQKVSALHASGIPIGTPPAASPYAGDGTFTPHVIASNLLNSPQTVTITVEYPNGAVWKSVEGPGGPATPSVRVTGQFKIGTKDRNDALNHPPNPDPATLTGQFTLAPLTIGPNSTADFSLSAALSQLPLPIAFCSIRIQYSGAPGSVIAQVSSVDEQQDLVVDARTANEGDGWAGSGSNPWHLDSQTTSTLFLTNEGETPARIGLDVTAGGVHYYLIRLTLAPHETRAIDLRALRDSQTPDFLGNRIPSGVADGSVNWVRLDSVAVAGRMMVIQKQQGMASSYDCSGCSCPGRFNALNATPDLFSLPPGFYEDIFGTGAYIDCNGYQFYEDVTFSTSFTSNNIPVIKMDSSVHNKADAIASGTATITATISACAQYDTNPDLPCPCILVKTFYGTSTGNVTPEILRGGCSGTNIMGTTQSAVTGQQIVLCGHYILPSGVTATSQSWSVGGTAVGSYNPSNSSTTVTDATLNQQSATFYWGYPGSSLNVKFTLNLSNGISPSASASFNVTGPTGGTLPTTMYNQVTVANFTTGCTGYPAGPYLAYGYVTGGTPCAPTDNPGISFNTPTGWSNTSGGSFSLVQLINTNSLSGSYAHSDSAGLDKGGYPYPGPPSNDGPLLQLLSGWTTETRSFNATMFLMWKSNTAGSIPVPLGYQTWAFSGTAKCSSNCGSASNWSATTNGTPGDVGSFTASNPSQSSVGNNKLKYGFPEW